MWCAHFSSQTCDSRFSKTEQEMLNCCLPGMSPPQPVALSSFYTEAERIVCVSILLFWCKLSGVPPIVHSKGLGSCARRYALKHIDASPNVDRISQIDQQPTTISYERQYIRCSTIVKTLLWVIISSRLTIFFFKEEEKRQVPVWQILNKP